MHGGMMQQIRKELSPRNRENYMQQRDIEREKTERVRRLFRQRKLYLHRLSEIDEEIEKILDGKN